MEHELVDLTVGGLVENLDTLRADRKEYLMVLMKAV